MKKLTREQNKKFNRISVIACTIISFITVFLTILIQGKNYDAGIGIAILGFFIIWICLYISLGIASYAIIELFNGFKEESLKRKIITIAIFLFIIVGLIVKITQDIKK
ncbi:hypothetical protein [Clostridium felsineum]|uniref:Uncharacterized protein n=1 Tax=Clostridium felsineum TaxID=36839 RepID=A0A1S8M2J2_9CLOT|nr:hypothetical protein [Clostridium felsineum]URZ04478.1 hypothetical protein CLAUR_045670 [Clostridium felsineum]URZ09281.1 hypothetical protein CLROS_046970 [Clostridium felsineum]URZ13967.1 hypothetical protein CROST_047450 [Clostridium felsineum]